jgi:hypothetical protein
MNCVISTILLVMSVNVLMFRIEWETKLHSSDKSFLLKNEVSNKELSITILQLIRAERGVFSRLTKALSVPIASLSGALIFTNVILFFSLRRFAENEQRGQQLS